MLNKSTAYRIWKDLRSKLFILLWETPSWQRFLRFYFSVSFVFVSIEKIYQTLETVFHRLSKYQIPRISSKILRCTSYFQLSSRCFDMPMKHCLSCLIYYIKHFYPESVSLHSQTLIRGVEKYYAHKMLRWASYFDSFLGVWKCDETLSRVFDINFNVKVCVIPYPVQFYKYM